MFRCHIIVPGLWDLSVFSLVCSKVFSLGVLFSLGFLFIAKSTGSLALLSVLEVDVFDVSGFIPYLR